MIHEVFISYVSEDESLAEALCRDIEAGRFKCWMAGRDAVGGKNYVIEISNALEVSRVLVLIYSPAAVRKNSRWIRREVSLADEQKMPVIPVLIDGASYSHDRVLKTRLVEIQFIETTSTNFGAVIPEIIRALRDVPSRETDEPEPLDARSSNVPSQNTPVSDPQQWSNFSNLVSVKLASQPSAHDNSDGWQNETFRMESAITLLDYYFHSTIK